MIFHFKSPGSEMGYKKLWQGLGKEKSQIKNLMNTKISFLQIEKL